MFTPSRDDVRQFFNGAWEKHRTSQVLTPLESMAIRIVAQHPEYHGALENPAAAQADYSVENGQTNPYLHLSLHLAIEEQVSIDQPPGIRAAYQRLCATGSEHDAIHVIMEALAEQIWEMQRLQKPYSNESYLERIHHHMQGA